MRRTVSILVFGLISVGLMAQEVTFEASTDSDQFTKGTVFNISFTLNNARGDHFKAPDFKSFRVISGPSQSFRSTSINGRLTQSISFIYSLQALQEGEFDIQPASIEIGGRVLFSNPVTIKVAGSPATTNPGASDGEPEQVLFRMETDSNEVYAGQQVVINYRIYTTVDIENIDMLNESKYDGCFAQTLELFNEPTQIETVNGVEYRTKVVRRVAVFPQQKGIITIEPAHVRVGIPDQSSFFRGLFSSFNLKSRTLTSNEIKLSVLSPYDQAPSLFSGAVGNFEIDFSLEPSRITTDDAVTITMNVMGNGDLKMVRPPVWDFSDDLEVFNPKVVSERILNSRDSLLVEKTVEYLMVVRRPGEFMLSPKFVYFHPGSKSFIETSDTFSIIVEAGKNYHASSDRNTPVIPDPAYADLVIREKTRLKRSDKRWTQDTISWILLFSPVSLWILSSIIKINKQASPENEASALFTLDKIRKAQIYIERQDADNFYSTISTQIKYYICHKLALEPSVFQHLYALDKMSENGASAESLGKFSEIIHTCNSALYSGYFSHSNMSIVLSDAEALINRLELELGKNLS